MADAAERGNTGLLSKSTNVLGSVKSVREAADAYIAAAYGWAMRAREVTRDFKGEDSPAFRLWSAAIDDGCWQGGGDLNFHIRWVDAGLARHSYCHRLLI